MRVTEKLGASKAKWIAGQKRRGVPTKEIVETANISARRVGKLRAWYKDAKTRVVPGCNDVFGGNDAPRGSSRALHI